MRNETVTQRLEATGIRLEPEFAVPINGVTLSLPYMVTRQKITVEGSDNGNVSLCRTEWTVALFSVNKAPDLEHTIRRALMGVGSVEITCYPDCSPYQTNFKFTTRQIMR